MARVAGKYFKVITVENMDSADILLYGVIGQEKWWDDDPTEPITDMELVKTIRDLEAKYSKINIRINSPGGSMYHGNAIITAMQSSTAEIHTWNDGLAASMGADIWLAGKHRHMAKNALMMIHAPSSWVWGTAKDMRKEADVLDKFEQTAIVVMAEATGLSEKDVKSTYYDYEDHWFTAKECEDAGFISKVEEYDLEEVIEGVEKMTLTQIMKKFEEKGDKQAKSWFVGTMQKITDSYQRLVGKVKLNNNQTEFEMKTVDDILKAVKEEKISKEELLKGLNAEKKAAEPTPNPTPEPPADDDGNPDIAKIVADAVKAANAPLLDRIKKLEDAPAATPTGGGIPDDPYKGMNETQKENAQRYNELNEQIANKGYNEGFGDY